MMKEENQFRDEGYIHIPTGSLWVNEPSFARDATEEEWLVAAEFLREFGACAESVNVALALAVVDAQQRCWEEARRAGEREATPEEERNRFGLSPGEDARLRTLLRRSDSLNNAIAVLEDNPMPSTRVQEDTLEALRNLSEEARAEVNRLKTEYGFND